MYYYTHTHTYLHNNLQSPKFVVNIQESGQRYTSLI